MLQVHIPNFGRPGSEDRGGSDSSIQVINYVRVGDKSLKEWQPNIGGERVGDNDILTFLFHCARNKMPRSCLFLNVFA